MTFNRPCKHLPCQHYLLARISPGSCWTGTFVQVFFFFFSFPSRASSCSMWTTLSYLCKQTGPRPQWIFWLKRWAVWRLFFGGILSIHEVLLFDEWYEKYLQLHFWRTVASNFLQCAEAIHTYCGGNLTVTGERATAGIFATYPAPYLSLPAGFIDQVARTEKTKTFVLTIVTELLHFLSVIHVVFVC